MAVFEDPECFLALIPFAITRLNVKNTINTTSGIIFFNIKPILSKKNTCFEFKRFRLN